MFKNCKKNILSAQMNKIAQNNCMKNTAECMLI